MMSQKHYVYIFVRQDISNEQQLVQSSHVALVLGTRLGRKYQYTSSKFNPDELYFTVIGIPTLKDFVQVQQDLGDVQYECFYEPDIGNQMTALASYPIPVNHPIRKSKLKKYKLLKFKK